MRAEVVGLLFSSSLSLLYLFLTCGGLAVGLVESIAVVKHAVYAAGNDYIKVVTFGKCAFGAYPYGIAETDGAFGELTFVVGAIDSLEDVGFVLVGYREDLGEEEIEEEFVLFILEVNEIKTLELELETELGGLRLEALLGKES